MKLFELRDETVQFAIRLDVPVEVPCDESESALYDVELDDVTTVLSDICASLSVVPGVEFGLLVDELICVDVGTDLVVVLEQLGCLVENIVGGVDAALELYEQGVESRVVFHADGESLRVVREDLRGRRPPSAVACARADAVESLRHLASTFLSAAHRRNPRRCEHALFREWRRVLGVQCDLRPRDANQ